MKTCSEVLGVTTSTFEFGGDTIQPIIWIQFGRGENSGTWRNIEALSKAEKNIYQKVNNTDIPQRYCSFGFQPRQKVKSTRMWVTQVFWLPSAYKNYVYAILCSIKYAIALCLENKVHSLFKKYFIAEKCQPSSEPSMNCNLFAGGGSSLDVDSMAAVDQGSVCWSLGG